ncbi:MAG: hypothetical protein Q9187_002188 [Circinaria calcarea]
MREWVRRIGYKPSDFNRLNIVHVAGTKGKGTTCAYVNSILTNYRAKTGLPEKIGLYTSPHLIAVRERIRINSEPVSESLFAKYFFEVWEALESSALAQGLDPLQKPVYFRFLTLLSFHVFMREGVDTAIYEVGVGGEFDSTNIIESPVVTGITTLGIDHTITLGETIEEIAWHKAGIFKSHCPAFSVEQVQAAVPVLEQRAEEKGVQLQVVKVHPEIYKVDIKPDEEFQRVNASLAIALANTVLEHAGVSTMEEGEKLPDEFVTGLGKAVWRGRCETKVEGNRTWCIDGAHTQDSLKVAGNWFTKVAQKRHARAFCNWRFPLLIILKDFVNRNSDASAISSLTVQKGFADLWRILDAQSQVSVIPTIEEAVGYVRQLSQDKGEIQILVTGSLHLVGGVLSFLEGADFATS